MINDSHVHTSFSEDSSAPPEDVIRQAIRLGMSSICITDHLDPDFPGGGWEFEPEEYFDTLQPLKEKYRDQIDVHIGMEMGMQPHLADHFRKLKKDYPFEFVIGSVHVLQGDDPFYRDRYDCDDREYYRLYFEYLLECTRACSGLFDTLGHMDYTVRYGYGGADEYSYERFREYIDPILDIVLENDAALEINTGSLRKGLDFLHPHDDVVRKYMEKGGRKFTVGSDAHMAKDVGSGFAEAESYLSLCLNSQIII